MPKGLDKLGQTRQWEALSTFSNAYEVV